MTEITKEIFEKHQVRKSKKQKADFIDFTVKKSAELGYTAKTEDGYLGAKNIVVGDVESAKVVYTAHYDTCAVLPFPNFITPKNFGIYLLYQLLLTLGFCFVAFGIGFGLGFLGGLVNIPSEVTFWCAYAINFVLICSVFAGPANKNTANDNTSGVTTLFSIMEKLPAEQKDKVAFVFFDLEEAGLFGSMGFAKKHKKVMAGKPLINFDCVSDGDDILFALKKGAAPLKEAFENAFPEGDGLKVHVLAKGVFYPSDQANFVKGVGVAALKKSKGGILYMNRIHTVRDTVYKEENIEFLSDGAVRLAEII